MSLNESELQRFIRLSLQEDIGDGDHTSLSTIPAGKTGKAKLLVKESGIIAGLELAKHIFYAVDTDLDVEILFKDGDKVILGDIVLNVSGSARSILMAERLVLNCMQRMSGIATTTKGIVDLLEGTTTKVLDTRKTTPLLRFLEKEAVRIGGGVNHRFGLYDMILIKDNHVDYAGGIAQAIKAAQQYLKDKGKSMQIEIEVRNFNELNEVLQCGRVDRILLDNFTPEQLKEAVKLIDGRFLSEASGGITPKNITGYAQTGVDYISMGALTHSVKSLDLSLKAIAD